jgi:hypothetical protein
MAFSSERVNSGSGAVVVVVVGEAVVVVVGASVVVVTGTFVVVGASVVVVVGASVVEVSACAGASVVGVVVGVPQATSPSTNAIDKMNIFFIPRNRHYREN